MNDLTRFQLRLLFLVPVLQGIAGALGIFGDHSQWPAPAQAYLAWFLEQPFGPIGWLLNRAAVVGLVGLLLGTVGLLFFWQPARYIYLVSLLLSFLGEGPAVPVLVGGWVHLDDVVAQTLIGINLALIFFGPGRQYFVTAAKSS